MIVLNEKSCKELSQNSGLGLDLRPDSIAHTWDSIWKCLLHFDFAKENFSTGQTKIKFITKAFGGCLSTKNGNS